MSAIDSIEAIVRDAKLGDENTGHRASKLGQTLSAEQRAKLFADVAYHLANAKTVP